MADLLPKDGPIRPEAASPYIIARTAPDELLRHDISDEELGVLADMRRDYLWEGKWVALGVFLGVAPACVDALWDAYMKDPGASLSVGDLFQVVVFFGALVAFGILWRVMKRKTSDSQDLAKAIRQRTKQTV